jgi:glutamyl-tRNA reductase
MSTPTPHESVSLELVGISHRTAPIDVLERLALSPPEIEALYARIRGVPGVKSALVLSTCNRTEVYALAEGDSAVSEGITSVLRDVAGPQRFPALDHLYFARGRDGLSHLFRVAAGLDSMVLGENQILGQVKDAYELSSQLLPPAPDFERMMRAALAAARRSRTETDIAKGAVSVASAAVHLASRIYSIERSVVVVVGAGETGRLLAEHFRTHAPRRLVIVNRSRERAEILAQATGGEARTLDDLGTLVAEADIVATAVRGDHPLLDRPFIERAMVHRGGRTLALIDLGLPRNVAHEAGQLPNVLVHDLEALRQVVDHNLGRRKRELVRVEAIIDQEVDRLLDSQREQAAGPLIAALRETVEAIRRVEVEKATQGLGDSERAAVDRATRAVVNKLLHGPMTSIKEIVKDPHEGPARLAEIHDVVQRLRPKR